VEHNWETKRRTTRENVVDMPHKFRLKHIPSNVNTLFDITHPNSKVENSESCNSANTDKPLQLHVPPQATYWLLRPGTQNSTKKIFKDLVVENDHAERVCSAISEVDTLCHGPRQMFKRVVFLLEYSHLHSIAIPKRRAQTRSAYRYMAPQSGKMTAHAPTWT
jgi:hypothetical protein